HEVAQLRPAPLVILARADDELDLVGIAQRLKLWIEVTPLLARTRRLDVHHPADAWVDLRHVDRPAGFERDPVAALAKLAKKVEATALRQRFSPGHADILRAIPGYLGQDVRDRPPLAAVEGVGRVAVLAAQRATREPHENGGNSYVLGLALER